MINGADDDEIISIRKLKWGSMSMPFRENCIRAFMIEASSFQYGFL